MKYNALLTALAALLIANHSAKAQGALTPPGAPAGSQKSLQEIYEAIQAVRTDIANLPMQTVIGVQGMVAVLGGILPEGSGLAGQVVAPFYIGKYEVTWGEWKTVRNWAVLNGYTDLANVGAGSGEDHPVTNVNFYHVAKWLNAKSEQEGLTPVYRVDGAIYRVGQSEPYVNLNLGGYRLPLEKEWEWAARGGIYSQGYIYSGSNDLNAVAWYSINSGGETKQVGTKTPNELGIYDMSGNAFEWLDEYAFDLVRKTRGGSVNYGSAMDFFKVNNRSGYNGSSVGHGDLGFRLARNAIGTK